jgi:hypothetical protein
MEIYLSINLLGLNVKSIFSIRFLSDLPSINDNKRVEILNVIGKNVRFILSDFYISYEYVIPIKSSKTSVRDKLSWLSVQGP